eukprot:scaffold260019_cov19-Tisochrysis_lutea.AAC.1
MQEGGANRQESERLGSGNSGSQTPGNILAPRKSYAGTEGGRASVNVSRAQSALQKPHLGSSALTGRTEQEFRGVQVFLAYVSAVLSLLKKVCARHAKTHSQAPHTSNPPARMHPAFEDCQESAQ